MKCYKLLVIIYPLFLMSCAISIQSSDMTPSLIKSEFISTHKSLTVGKITGISPTNSLLHIENKELKEAIVKTFVVSGIFKEVLPERTGDYQLSANTISLKSLGGYSSTSQLLIRYKFVDNANGKTLWTGNIFSQESLSLTDEFLGVKRSPRVLQMAIKDNLNQLVRKIHSIMSKEIENKQSEVTE